MKQIWLLILITGLLNACTKVDYTAIENPAYVRVFNDLNYGFFMDDKDKQVPFLCMIVNPTFDGKGLPTGGEVVGDFLDVRARYAPPYPSHIGSSTSVNNPEYPGKEKVLTGPILNGFDLSSWAQMKAGTTRFLFLYRPKNNVPYFQLDERLQGNVLFDTTVELTSHGVHTLHLLQKDYSSNRVGVLLRRENFHELPLSDSMNYVNFYNYSADGFTEADDNSKLEASEMGHFQWGIKDKMDIFLSLYQNQETALTSDSYFKNPVPGWKGEYLTTVVRDNNTDKPNPYVSFPLWANPQDNGIVTASWQSFDLFTPGMTPANNPYGNYAMKTAGNWAQLNCLGLGLQRPSGVNYCALQPNLIVNIHSGVHNPRSFATVSTIEVINGGVYLTTIQRKYDPPIY